jgi:hypoxanthine phosphoribosyltransferase
MLAGNLGLVPLVVLDTILEKTNGVSHARIRFSEACPPLKDKAVLVVVGEVYSGEDLKVGIDYVKRRHPRVVKSGTLLTHPAAGIFPDFIAMESDRPLSAPWRITDQYKHQRL